MALGGPDMRDWSMMPRFRFAVQQDEATPAERRSLFQVRRECLDHGTALRNGGRPLDVKDRWGWRARIKTLGRDRDGSLLASVTVTAPSGDIVVLRNVRLVKEYTLSL